MVKIIIGREYPDIITKYVKEAQISIKILSYDWRWYGSEIGSRIQIFNNEIMLASSRGVNVSALLNSDSIIPIFQGSKITIKKVNSKKTMHIKMVIIDGKYLFIGSHNLTKNAFELNHEISLLVDDQEAISRCDTFFKTLCLV